jgi:hypothetical protein
MDACQWSVQNLLTCHAQNPVPLTGVNAPNPLPCCPEAGMVIPSCSSLPLGPPALYVYTRVCAHPQAVLRARPHAPLARAHAPTHATHTHKRRTTHPLNAPPTRGPDPPPRPFPRPRRFSHWGALTNWDAEDSVTLEEYTDTCPEVDPGQCCLRCCTSGRGPLLCAPTSASPTAICCESAQPL